jgi:hypothetical protein
LSINFDDALSALAVETAVSTIERESKQVHPQIRRIFVEAQSREGHLLAQAETAPLEIE